MGPILPAAPCPLPEPQANPRCLVVLASAGLRPSQVQAHVKNRPSPWDPEQKGDDEKQSNPDMMASSEQMEVESLSASNPAREFPPGLVRRPLAFLLGAPHAMQAPWGSD